MTFLGAFTSAKSGMKNTENHLLGWLTFYRLEWVSSPKNFDCFFFPHQQCHKVHFGLRGRPALDLYTFVSRLLLLKATLGFTTFRRRREKKVYFRLPIDKRKQKETFGIYWHFCDFQWIFLLCLARDFLACRRSNVQLGSGPRPKSCTWCGIICQLLDGRVVLRRSFYRKC